MTNKLHTIFGRFALVSFSLILVLLPAQAKKKAPKAPERVKYVFYMIGDGMGINEVFGAQLYNQATGFGPATLNFTTFQRGFVTTHCANSLVTDSAAAGTALATGSKTNSGYIGVDPDNNPLQTLAEKAKAAGYGAGVVSSVGVNHATPASFYAHSISRNNYDTIAMQYIASKVDFAAGGGFNLEKASGHDAEFYVAEARKAGIEVYAGKEAIKGIKPTKNRVLCIGDDIKKNELAYSIDQTESSTQLADFTEAAINYLSANHPQGFFLMVEGGSIDHGGHDDDAATDFMEINDFAKSVDLALAFYQQHPDETVIVVTADHETGGLILGAGAYSINPARLASQTVSKSVLTARLNALKARENADMTWDEVKGVLSECLGLWTTIPVPQKQEDAFKAMYERAFVQNEDDAVVNLYAVNSRLVQEAVLFADEAAGYTWSFGSHSGSPVGLYVKGAQADKFLSCFDNTDIPKTISAVAAY